MAANVTIAAKRRRHVLMAEICDQALSPLAVYIVERFRPSEVHEPDVGHSRHGNERQAKRMPMLFSPTIGATSRPAIGSYGRADRPAASPATLTCGHWIGTRAVVTALIPALSCRCCRPNAPLAELVCLRRRGRSGATADGPRQQRRTLLRPFAFRERMMTVALCVGWRERCGAFQTSGRYQRQHRARPFCIPDGEN